jgi:methylated-DNA-[protein]-cysteine S-methyltransferase
MTTARTATLSTPDGPFTVVVGAPVADAPAAVLASGWTDDPGTLLPLVHPGLRPVKLADGTDDGTDDGLRAAVDAVTAYYDGDLAAVAAVPVRQRSGEYRQHAWEVLRALAPGERVTYTQYAARTGRPAAVRAAAGACATNAAALFVPCHRVLRTDGSLGGFRYGLGVKGSLLARELRGVPAV